MRPRLTNRPGGGRAAVATLLAVAALAAAPPSTVPAAAQQAAEGVVMDFGVAIPTRDGTTLNATIYRPADAAGQLPVVLGFTPYTGDSYHRYGVALAKQGLAFAAVDVRGRGSSGGEFAPFENEALDGYDAVEWLAAQPWSDGQVAMFGGSYGGFDQWTVVKERPPHLVTIAPYASAYLGHDFPSRYRIFYAYDTQWLTFTTGGPVHPNLFGDGEFWASRFWHRYTRHEPFRTLDRLVGNPSPMFQKWLRHPSMDDYWASLAPSAEDYAAIDVPILTVTGHYDGDQPGALRYFREHMRHGDPAATARHYLVIGPWDHGGTRVPRETVGGVPVGKAGVVDMNELNGGWYRWHMAGGAKPDLLKDRVSWYVMGADVWKHAPSLEAIPTVPTPFYLESEAGRANDVFASGRLAREAPSGAAEPDRWVYDPLDTRPGELEWELARQDGRAAAYTDQTAALNLFGHGVVYHTAPFDQATEITGAPRLVAHIAMDVPDTDLAAELYEIRADGSSILLTEAALRARYRESEREPKPVPIGEVVRYEIDTFMFFSRQIAEGSRLRLVVRSPNSIYWQKNYNSGGDVSDETAADARTAHLTLYHDAEHPSFLELPIARDAARPATEQGADDLSTEP